MVTTHKNGTEAALGRLEISVPRIELKQLELTLIGDSPLICHAWAAKARQMMLDKQMKKGTQAKQAKEPWMDFCSSLYWLDGMPEKPTQKDIDATHAASRFGFPAIGFKATAVTASGDADGMKMTQSRRRFHINEEMIELHGDKPTMREDMVRISMGTADIRYRGELKHWWVELPVTYNSRAISVEQIISLYNLAGFGVGIAEWRPENGGQFGRFHVASEAEAGSLH